MRVKVSEARVKGCQSVNLHKGSARAKTLSVHGGLCKTSCLKCLNCALMGTLVGVKY